MWGKAKMGALRPCGLARGIKAILGLRPSPAGGTEFPRAPADKETKGVDFGKDRRMA